MLTKEAIDWFSDAIGESWGTGWVPRDGACNIVKLLQSNSPFGEEFRAVVRQVIGNKK